MHCCRMERRFLDLSFEGADVKRWRGEERRRKVMKSLIVEDDPVTGRLLYRFLSPLGHCDVAENGVEALEAFREAVRQKSPYQLICLDIMLPKMSGHEILMRIRDFETKRGIPSEERVKVLMTTSCADRGNVVRAIRGSCQGYLIKPIEKERLMKELQTLGLFS